MRLAVHSLRSLSPWQRGGRAAAPTCPSQHRIIANAMTAPPEGPTACVHAATAAELAAAQQQLVG